MNTANRIKNIISTQYGIDEFSDDDFVEETLGITGDDAWELIELLEQEFNLDLSNFDFSLHFSPEAGSNSNKEYGYYPVSISHLYKVVKEGAWILPGCNEKNFLSVKRRARIIKLFWLLAFLAFIVFIYLKEPNTSCKKSALTSAPDAKPLTLKP